MTATWPAAGATFEIYLAWSDRTLTVPAGKSALQALLAAGIPIAPGCLTGACGECVTAYVEGDVLHKDSTRTAASTRKIARATSARACRAPRRGSSCRFE